MSISQRQRSAAFGLAAVAVILALFFGRLLFVPNVIYSGDTAREYLPQRVTLAASLQAGQLPWWEPNLGIGYPLLAEGETAVLYPVNWLLLALLPADLSLNASLILHVLLCGLGIALWLRQIGLPVAAAAFGAGIFTLGGFYAAHYGHLSIIAAAAWLPWLLLLSEGLITPSGPRRTIWIRAGLLAAVVALQFAAGHAQISLLTLLLSTIYTLSRWLQRTRHAQHHPGDAQPPRTWAIILLWIGALLAGGLLASPQLAASWQLSQLSERAGGLDNAFFTSFSFHPLLSATFLSPYLLGNPYPSGSVELIGYVGLLPLLLAGIALVYSSRTIKWLLLGIGVLGLLLAFGRWNPLYLFLQRLPVFNLFRVPARFLLWVDLALASLAALGLEVVWFARWKTPNRAPLYKNLLALLVTAGALFGLSRLTLDASIALWRWLPLVLGAAVLLLGLAIRRIERPFWLLLAASLLVVDIYAFQSVLNATYNRAAPLQEIRQPPAAAAWLAQDTGLYRLYTKEEILPIDFVQKASFYPNYALTYGFSSANLYMPLVPTAYQHYLDDLDATRLNALNVRYYMIPQLLPVDAASELYDVANPYASPPYNAWLELPPVSADSVELESYLSHAADLPQGALAARILLRLASGQVITLPIRAGIESAEWAYERPDVAHVVSYPMPPVASTFPARSGYPPKDHPGHTYLATWGYPQPITISAVFIEPLLPEAFVRIERMLFKSDNGEPVLLNHLLGLGDHRIAYRSEDVLIYRNADARPRAYTVSLSDAAATNGGITVVEWPASLRAATIDQYTAHQVILSAELAEAGYLILADLCYPGWSATVDGEAAKIVCADGIFRAVALLPGAHEVIFSYQLRLNEQGRTADE